MLSKESIQQFKLIYKKVFREEISDDEAEKRADKLLSFYKSVYLPIESENLMIKQDDEPRRTN